MVHVAITAAVLSTLVACGQAATSPPSPGASGGANPANTTASGDASSPTPDPEPTTSAPMEGDSSVVLGVERMEDTTAPLDTPTVTLFSNGLLVVPGDKEWRQQLLSAAGIEALLAVATDGGLLDESRDFRRVPSDFVGGASFVRIILTMPERSVAVSARAPDPEPGGQEVFDRADELAALAQDVPDAWLSNPGAPYTRWEPEQYLLVVGLSAGALDVLTQPPEILLWAEDMDISIVDWAIQAHDGVERPEEVIERCTIVGRDEAVELRRLFYDAGHEPTAWDSVIAEFALGWRATNGVIYVTLVAPSPGVRARCS